MPELTIKEYTKEEYERDLKNLLCDKGLKGAVKEYCDKINEEVSGTGYIIHSTVQEFLNDILNLIDFYNNGWG